MTSLNQLQANRHWHCVQRERERDLCFAYCSLFPFFIFFFITCFYFSLYICTLLCSMFFFFFGSLWVLRSVSHLFSVASPMADIIHPPMEQLQDLEYCIDSNPPWGMLSLFLSSCFCYLKASWMSNGVIGFKWYLRSLSAFFIFSLMGIVFCNRTLWKENGFLVVDEFKLLSFKTE